MPAVGGTSRRKFRDDASPLGQDLFGQCPVKVGVDPVQSRSHHSDSRPFSKKGSPVRGTVESGREP